VTPRDTRGAIEFHSKVEGRERLEAKQASCSSLMKEKGKRVGKTWKKWNEPL